MGEVVLVARLLLGFVLAFSSFAKLWDFTEFVHGVELYEVLPHRLNAAGALTIIILEATVAASLLAGVATWFGLGLAIALLLVFLGVMVHNAHRDQPLPCFCFGRGDSAAHPRRAIVRLTLLLTVALVVAFGQLAGGAKSRVVAPTLYELLLGLAAVVLGAWLLMVVDLWAWHRTPVPLIANVGRRVSLRSAPLTVPGDQEQGDAER